jgi:adenosylcobinamide hydrolase
VTGRAGYEPVLCDGVLALRRPGTRWLSTGHDGGYRDADAAYNVTVPEGFERTDLERYVADRLAGAGFEAPGPSLLTGVEMRHARCARRGPVLACATAGVSNPAELPMSPGEPGSRTDATDDWRPGTVNLLVGTDRSLGEGALASLLGVVVEAKAATLLDAVGVPGTTSDAAVVGSAPDGEPARFAGSATAVGAAARACVRDALLAGLRSRYPDADPPGSVAEAEYGVRTDRPAAVFAPGETHSSDRPD